MCVSLQKKLYIYTFVYKFKPIYIQMSFHSLRKRVILLHSKRQKKTLYTVLASCESVPHLPHMLFNDLQGFCAHICIDIYIYIHTFLYIYIYQYMSNISQRTSVCTHKIEYIYIYIQYIYIYIRIFAFLLLQPKNLCTFGVLAIPKNTTHWMNGLHWRLVNLPSFLVFGPLRGTLDVLIYRQRWLKHFDHLGRTAEGAGYMPYIP